MSNTNELYEVLQELEDNLNLLSKMDWFIECVAYAFFTLSAKLFTNNCLE